MSERCSTPVQPVVSDVDRRRLGTLLDLKACARGTLPRTCIRLASKLERAIAVEAEQIPHDVVTMNSSFVLHEVTSGKSKVATLVYPDEVWRDGAISVLSPLGMALLGARASQRLQPDPTKEVPNVQIREVLYQPEAAGDFDR